MRWIKALLFFALSLPAAAQISSRATSLRGQALCNPLGPPVDGQVLAYVAATKCWNASVVGIVANYSITGLTSASGPTTAYTTTAAGDYLMCINAWITTAGTGGTMTVYYSATAVATAMPFVLQMNPVNGSLLGGGQTSGCVTLHAANATVIQYQTGFNSATGSPAYSLDVTVQRVK